MKKYITIEKSACFELEVKRSRFIALASPLADEEAFRLWLGELRRSYPQARHYVYAWVLGGFGERQAMQKYTDDGEPSGTAGLPLLKKLQAYGLTQAAVVVIRYFGGILLGTGGLSRAYASAAEGVLEAAERVEMREMDEYALALPYALYEQGKLVLAENAFPLYDKNYSDQVRCKVAAASGRSPELKRFLAELSGGSVALEYIQNIYRPFSVAGEPDERGVKND